MADGRQAQHVGRHGRVAQPTRCRRRLTPSTEKGDEGDGRNFLASPSSLRRITSFSRDYNFAEAVLSRFMRDQNPMGAQRLREASEPIR